MTSSDPFPEGYEIVRETPIDVIAGLRASPANKDDPEGPTLRDVTQNCTPLDYIRESDTVEDRERRILEDFDRRNPPMMRNHPSYARNLDQSSDIQEHLGLLRGMAMQCEQVVELGFRTGVSTSAFLAGGANVRSYDIEKYPCRPFVQRLAKEYPDTFVFKEGDSREVSIPPCDLLFIDTDHTYATTRTELNLHNVKAKRWIVLHDTVSFGRKDRKSDGPGVMTAIEDFLEINTAGKDWRIILHLPNNNGLTILERRT